MCAFLQVIMMSVCMSCICESFSRYVFLLSGYYVTNDGLHVRTQFIKELDRSARWKSLLFSQEDSLMAPGCWWGHLHQCQWRAAGFQWCTVHLGARSCCRNNAGISLRAIQDHKATVISSAKVHDTQSHGMHGAQCLCNIGSSGSWCSHTALWDSQGGAEQFPCWLFLPWVGSVSILLIAR